MLPGSKTSGTKRWTKVLNSLDFQWMPNPFGLGHRQRSAIHMNNIRVKDSCKPARLVREESGSSSFGGEPAHDGAHPGGWKQPLHLVATLDASSSAFPLKNYPIANLPLYYPFASDFPSLQYQVKSEREIEIIHVSRYQSESRPMIETTFLPHFRATLMSFTYEEARAMALSEMFSAYEMLPEDKLLTDKSHAFSSVRTGSRLKTFQGDLSFKCRNTKCDFHEKPSRIDVFCITPCSRKLAPDRHWGSYNEFVDLVFGLCPFCGTIVSTNVST